MRYIHRHIQTIIERYEGEIPLSLFLKSYFKKHPVLGSRDRKMLSEMAFAWYRASKAFDKKLSFDKKLEACLFICDTHVHQLLQLLRPEWQGKHDYFPDQKVALLQREKTGFDIEQLFPFDIKLSEGIDKQEWLMSMFRQPDLFIRYRKNPKALIKILDDNKVNFRQINDTCFALPNGTKLEQLLSEKDYVVQDASSQQTGSFFLSKPKESWWDCCSGAGGKSILLKDINSSVKLTVSDKRESILHNLKSRFSLYFKNTPDSIVVDSSDIDALQIKLKGSVFDNVICDVPCSGSGTWARTPEQMYFFEKEKLKDFSKLQAQIAANTVPFLKPGGRILYITCSVFQKENEDVVQQIRGVEIENRTLINGIENKADSMFVTTLRKGHQ